MESTDELLLIFIKNPQQGKVKTRLAANAWVSAKALEVYQALLAHTHQITASMERPRQVWYSSFIDRDDRWEQGGFDKQLQSATTSASV
ncbi:MAG: hypothetical protein U5J63_06185 [Fodinibius sp.]|nr:hypothetical protein [Fodinibius sp.]